MYVSTSSVSRDSNVYFVKPVLKSLDDLNGEGGEWKEGGGGGILICL